jgi:hypothetical protein
MTQTTLPCIYAVETCHAIQIHHDPALTLGASVQMFQVQDSNSTAVSEETLIHGDILTLTEAA